MQTSKAQASLHPCAGLPEPSLLALTSWDVDEGSSQAFGHLVPLAMHAETVTLVSWQKNNELQDPTYYYSLDTSNFMVSIL